MCCTNTPVAPTRRDSGGSRQQPAKDAGPETQGYRPCNSDVGAFLLVGSAFKFARVHHHLPFSYAPPVLLRIHGSTHTPFFLIFA